MVLTAAHCVNEAYTGGVTFVISFDSSTGPSNYPAHFIVGTPDPDPAWMPADAKPGSASFLDNEANDVGLLHLDQAASTGWPGIQPAPIAAANSLAPYAKGNGSNPLLLQVGYGVERSGAPGQAASYTYDGVRYQSQWPIKKLSDALFFGNANPNNAVGYGGPCFGDSGSPLLLNSAVAGVLAFANTKCQNLAGGVRVDTGPGRDFLVSRGLVP